MLLVGTETDDFDLTLMALSVSQRNMRRFTTLSVKLSPISRSFPGHLGLRDIERLRCGV